MGFRRRPARLGAVGLFFGGRARRRPRRERGIALRKQAPRRKKRARADDGPGDRVIALLLSNGAAKRPADDPAYHAHVSFRSEEHTSELQSLMRISYAVFCLKKKKTITKQLTITSHDYI